MSERERATHTHTHTHTHRERERERERVSERERERERVRERETCAGPSAGSMALGGVGESSAASIPRQPQLERDLCNHIGMYKMYM